MIFMISWLLQKCKEYKKCLSVCFKDYIIYIAAMLTKMQSRRTLPVPNIQERKIKKACMHPSMSSEFIEL